MASKGKATIEDLYCIKGKAELVGGKIILLPPAGAMPGFASGEIMIALRNYERLNHPGRAVGGNAAFVVNLPNRESFCPDAAYYIGPDAGMKFFEGAPVFAVEVRNEEDYSPEAEQRAMAAKRADYFAAGTIVVWDLDLLSNDVVRVYRNNDPNIPAAVYRRGEIAEAEPAVLGWRMTVNDLFE